MRASRPLLAALLLGAACTVAAAGEPPRLRLDPQLRMVRAGLLRPSHMAAAGSALRLAVELPGGAAQLRAFGFTGARPALPGSDLAWLEIRSSDELSALARVPGLRTIERAPLLHPTLDKSLPACGAPSARSQLGLDGRGVVVGVVDTGVDFRHRDFRDGAGRTRIAALLDASTARGALHPELPDYGGAALWLRADIDAHLEAEALGATPAVPVVEADSDGHGSHVAGIAVSTGLATGQGRPDGRFVGVAPGADLVVAKATRVGDAFQLEDVLGATRFVLETAERAGRPAVVNLSLGGDSGPHDGTSAFERALAALAPEDAPGRCLVVSAGNAGGRDRHAGGISLPPHSEITVSFPASAKESDRLAIELWFDGAPPSVSMRSPDGVVVGPARPGQPAIEGRASGAGTVRLDVASDGRDPGNGRWSAGVVVTGEDGKAVRGGQWILVLDGGGGRWDAWITDASSATADPRFLDHLDPDTRGDFPAFASSVISAGSFVSRSSWRTLDGRAVLRPTVEGRASTFTGTGPTADGRFFPDVVAPGDYVISALSASAPPETPGTAFYAGGDPTLLVADDGVHGALRGTSQAAPHVAGAIALLYQIDPRLTPRRIRELLRASATPLPGEPGYSTRGGFGRLDVLRAALLLRRSPTGAHDPARSTLGASRDAVAPGERVLLSLVPRDATAAPLGPGHTVGITADGGRFEGETRDLGEGRYERTLIADAPLGAVLTASALVDGQPVAARAIVWVVRSRQDVGHPFVLQGGGCALSGRAHPAADRPVVVAAALAVVTLAGRRRRRRRRYT